uniref:Uncharacterized protein n=1 Tax=Arundo donax TaxID=35708 RepID=A0A0A8Z0E5_ARUDO
MTSARRWESESYWIGPGCSLGRRRTVLIFRQPL